ncbi:MAG: hypothetical protein ACI8UO_003770, partial [Verrucomicrobiales bacterium]
HGGDARTGAQIAFDGSNIVERGGPGIDAYGPWAKIDLLLYVWHDTPLDLEVQLLTGMPITAELPRGPGSEVAKYKIAGMPDLPNPRRIKNLFETRIPLAVLATSSPEFAIQGHIAVGAQITWDKSDFKNGTSSEAVFPDDLTFRDTSPQQLLD